MSETLNIYIKQKCDEVNIKILTPEEFKIKRMNIIYHQYYYKLMINDSILPSLFEEQILNSNSENVYREIFIKYKEHNPYLLMKVSLLRFPK